MQRLIVGLCCLLLATAALAHGGGTSQPNVRPEIHQRSPLDLALDSYRAGLKNMAAAASFEEKAADANSDRKKIRHHKKAGKQYQRAKRKFAIALKYEPELYQAHDRLGYAFHQTGDYADAIRFYSIAMKLQPRNARIVADRALSYLALGRLEEAQTAYKLLSRLDRSIAAELLAEMQEWQEGQSLDNQQVPEESLAQSVR